MIVRVGKSTIGKSALVRAITALAPEQIAPEPPRYAACIRREETLAPGVAKAVLKGECEQQYRTLRNQALNYLVSSHWLIEEASSRGLRVSERETERQLRSRGRASPVAGVTRGDATFQARAELSALKLRRTLSEEEPRITSLQVSSYYRRHIGRFERQELRYVDLAENFAHVAAAIKVKEDIEAGASLARISLHEILERYNLKGREKTRKAAEEAIFAAKPHVLSGPVKLNETYSIFEVTRVVPPRRTPLSRVRHAIERQLQREQRRRNLIRFIDAWRAKWIARTDCARGYVVERCRQYRGISKPPLSSTSSETPAKMPVELLETP